MQSLDDLTALTMAVAEQNLHENAGNIVHGPLAANVRLGIRVHGAFNQLGELSHPFIHPTAQHSSQQLADLAAQTGQDVVPTHVAFGAAVIETADVTIGSRDHRLEVICACGGALRTTLAKSVAFRTARAYADAWMILMQLVDAQV